MNEKKTYFAEVDVVKGIAILLVILGHSFCQYPINVGEHFPMLSSVVRSFQMPLFFIASGFLFSLETPFAVFVKKKAKRIIVPFIVFCMLSIGLRSISSSFTNGGKIILQEALWGALQGHYYWFLYSLIWIMMVTLAVKNKLILSLLAAFAVVCCALTDIELVKFFTIGRTVYYFPFFIVGLFFRQWYRLLKQTTKRNIGLTTVLLAAVYVLAMKYGKIGESAAAYAIGLSGSLTAWFTVLCLSRFNMNLLRHFGRYSLQYYLNHLLIMLPCYYIGGHTFTPPILQLLTIAILGIMISRIMLQVEKRFAFTRACCGL